MWPKPAVPSMPEPIFKEMQRLPSKKGSRKWNVFQHLTIPHYWVWTWLLVTSWYLVLGWTVQWWTDGPGKKSSSGFWMLPCHTMAFAVGQQAKRLTKICGFKGGFKGFSPRSNFWDSKWINYGLRPLGEAARAQWRLAALCITGDDLGILDLFAKKISRALENQDNETYKTCTHASLGFIGLIYILLFPVLTLAELWTLRRSKGLGPIQKFLRLQMEHDGTHSWSHARISALMTCHVSVYPLNM